MFTRSRSIRIGCVVLLLVVAAALILCSITAARALIAILGGEVRIVGDVALVFAEPDYYSLVDERNGLQIPRPQDFDATVSWFVVVKHNDDTKILGCVVSRSLSTIYYFMTIKTKHSEYWATSTFDSLTELQSTHLFPDGSEAELRAKYSPLQWIWQDLVIEQ